MEMDSPQASGSSGKDKASGSNGKDKLVIHIPSDLDPVEWPECCIYRVPKKLRKVNKEAYTPKLVSIGPFHHGRKELRDMENLKGKYLKEFLHRTMQSQENLLRFIIDKENKIRRCYSEECRLNTKDFVQMILLDAIFIIELFLKVIKKETDYILNKPWLRDGIFYDLILLENQLPFFVLEKLYMFAFNIDSSSCNHREEGKQMKEHQRDLNKEDTPFLKLSGYFFSAYDIDKHEKSNIGGKVKHFTDLLRYFFCPPELKCSGYQYSIYSATKLYEAGLQFKSVEDYRPLLDIRFPANKWLKYCPCLNLSWLLSWLPCLKCFQVLEGMERFVEVPAFKIDDHTECIFRNLIALEQCYYPTNAYICNYVVLMDDLINTEEDVALLVDKNVIINRLGSNAAVAALIKNLINGIVLDGSCYSVLAEEINQYRDHPCIRIPAAMKSTYFNDFGRVNATVATLLALVGLFLPILTNNGCKCN